MTTKKFCTGCALMWGPAWKSEAARQLDVSLPSVNRYAAGERDVPEELHDKLQVLLMRRRHDIDKFLTKM